MPTEMRQIAFKQQEISRALVEYHRRRDMKFPTGSIKKVEIEDEPEVYAVVTMDTPGIVDVEIKVGAENLAAALILYCINHKIPLPAESAKRLQKVGDGVALFVVKRHKVPTSIHAED